MTTEFRKRSLYGNGAVEIFKRTAISLGVAAALYPIGQVQAQEEDDEILEEIIVTGIRQTYRDSLDIKRDATTIVDALSSRDIGALPDNSVAESLERITGVSGDRFKGNASEISIRGMGPFLGSSTFNGRPISSGSGSRAVAFSQFPSELVNGAVVYKAQQADIREGGVSGTVDLQTIKPLEYGKRRIAIDIRGNYNPYDANIDTGWGQRGSISFTDVFETDIGEFGFAIGYAGRDVSTPEQSFNSSSNFRDCDQDFTAATPSSDTFRNCETNNRSVADPLVYDPSEQNPSTFNAGPDTNGDGIGDGFYLPGQTFDPAIPADNTTPYYHDGVGYGDGYYFIPNLTYWRSMESEEEQDAWVTALQWQPNEQWDINIDAQYSDRTYYEDRKDLYLDDGRRRIHNVTATDAGALLSYSGESRLSSYGDYRVRGEIYQGAGLNIKYMPSETVTIEFDAASSDTMRRQTMTWARLRSDRYYYNLQYAGAETFPVLTLLDGRNGMPLDMSVDGDNPQLVSFFDANMEARSEKFQISDEIESFSLDGKFEFDSFITSAKVGLDWSEHHFLDYDEDRITYSPSGIQETDLSFCEDTLLDKNFGEDGGAFLQSWWQFDTHCANKFMRANSSNGDEESNPSAPKNSNIDMTETVTSVFGLVEFLTEVGNVELSGNFGVRYVATDIESTSFRKPYETQAREDAMMNTYYIVDQNDGADFVAATLKNDFTNVLPSLNLNFTISEDIQVRFAAYSALSRPDMWYMGAGRTLNFDNDDALNDLYTQEEARTASSTTISAIGNPFLEALESDNIDLSTTYYFSEDTAFSVALYAKDFSASYGVLPNGQLTEEFLLDSQLVNFDVGGKPVLLDESETITGVELTLQSVFTFLPAPFDGLGTSLNYNFADSSFETPENGADINEEIERLVTPSNLAGLSENVFSGQFYYETDRFAARLSYKYRSEYLKPFGNNLEQTNRIVDDTESWDFDIGYEVIDNLKVRFQALNFTNEPYVEQRVVQQAYNRIEYGGPRYFLGVQYRIY